MLCLRIHPSLQKMQRFNAANYWMLYSISRMKHTEDNEMSNMSLKALLVWLCTHMDECEEVLSRQPHGHKQMLPKG